MDYIITIKPKYCDAFASGKKSIEIRKRVPIGLCVGDRIFVCRGGSNGIVQMCLGFDSFIVGSPNLLYELYKKRLGMEQHEYVEYVAGCSQVVCLRFCRVEVFRTGLWVQDLGIKKPPKWFARVLQYPEKEKVMVLKRYSFHF